MSGLNSLSFITHARVFSSDFGSSAPFSQPLYSVSRKKKRAKSINLPESRLLIEV